MQIILVHQRLTQARTITLGSFHLVLASLGLLVLILVGAALLNFVAAREPGWMDLPVLRDAMRVASVGQEEGNAKFVRSNLDAMARKLAEMQAQLTRLEALGERVSGLAGLNPQDFNFRDPPPRGGATPSDGHPLSSSDVQSQLDLLAQGIEHRADYLNVAESALMDAKLKSKMMPTSLPVAVEYNASGFGWRIDPFTGEMAMHEGIDFVAAPGTPIGAAAGGVVISSEWHHDFGNMIEIDHGNDITTLYAHTSRVYVHVGDVVRRNQHIADVGATGRATGPHLHFEVHVKGVPQNPTKFLESGGAHQASNTPATPAASGGATSAAARAPVHS